jgi:hypothetical protein
VSALLESLCAFARLYVEAHGGDRREAVRELLLMVAAMSVLVLNVVALAGAVR